MRRRDGPWSPPARAPGPSSASSSPSTWVNWATANSHKTRKATCGSHGWPLTWTNFWWSCVDLNHGPPPYQGCFSDQRHLLEPSSASLLVCPRVTVTVPERPPDRARGGHDPLIRRFLYRRPAPFRTVHDLGLVSSGCPGGSGTPEGCSSPWLPADDSVTPWSSSPSPDPFPAIWPRPVLSQALRVDVP
jgi:hypothetical protein